jgi:hypothetical protein
MINTETILSGSSVLCTRQLCHAIIFFLSLVQCTWSRLVSFSVFRPSVTIVMARTWTWLLQPNQPPFIIHKPWTVRCLWATLTDEAHHISEEPQAPTLSRLKIWNFTGFVQGETPATFSSQNESGKHMTDLSNRCRSTPVLQTIEQELNQRQFWEKW